MKTINNRTYKTVEEILSDIVLEDNVHYSRPAEQLASIALTEFAKFLEEEKDIVIISCHPKLIKCEDKIDTPKIPTLGNWIKWLQNDVVGYIQFDENPFFPPKGYAEKYIQKGTYIMNKVRKSTGIDELPYLFSGVNEYSTTEDNINQLVKNLKDGYKTIFNWNFRSTDEDIRMDNLKQTIYRN